MHSGDGRRRIGQTKNRQHLCRHPLPAQAFHRFGEVCAGFFRSLVQLSAEAGLKTIIAQYAQMILVDAFTRITDEAYTPRFQIAQSAEVIADLQRFGVSEQCIDGEIAPCGVFAPLLRKRDSRTPSIGCDIAAQCGDFHWPPIQQGGDGAVIDAGGHGADARILQQTHDLIGMKRRGCIHIIDRCAQQSVAHGSAHPADIICAEGTHEGREIAAPGPICLI